MLGQLLSINFDEYITKYVIVVGENYGGGRVREIYVKRGIGFLYHHHHEEDLSSVTLDELFIICNAI